MPKRKPAGSGDERRRIAVEFGFGDPETECPDDVERSVFGERPPLAEWETSCSKWYAAANGLCFGQTELLANALDSTEPILETYENILVLALRGDAGLPFKLEVIGVKRPGQKRAGRPKNGKRLTAEKLAELTAQGALQHPENRRLFAAALGQSDLPFRIVVRSNTRGRLPGMNGIRNLRFAVRMAQSLEEMRKRGERDPYRAASKAIANKRGVHVGSRSVEAAYEAYKNEAHLMRNWSKELCDELKKQEDPPSVIEK